MMAELGSAAPRRSERMTVRTTLAEAPHHSCGVGSNGTNNALRGPKAASKVGELPGVLKVPKLPVGAVRRHRALLCRRWPRRPGAVVGFAVAVTWVWCSRSSSAKCWGNYQSYAGYLGSGYVPGEVKEIRTRELEVFLVLVRQNLAKILSCTDFGPVRNGDCDPDIRAGFLKRWAAAARDLGSGVCEWLTCGANVGIVADPQGSDDIFLGTECEYFIDQQFDNSSQIPATIGVCGQRLAS